MPNVSLFQTRKKRKINNVHGYINTIEYVHQWRTHKGTFIHCMSLNPVFSSVTGFNKKVKRFLQKCYMICISPVCKPFTQRSPEKHCPVVMHRLIPTIHRVKRWKTHFRFISDSFQIRFRFWRILLHDRFVSGIMRKNNEGKEVFQCLVYILSLIHI